MNLLDWLNKQKIPLLGDGLKEKCSQFKLKKVEDLKKYLTTLSAAEIVKLLDVSMSFDALSDGVHLLDALRDYELALHKTYPPWAEVKALFGTRFTPNFGSLVNARPGDDQKNLTSTTMEEIVKKWDGLQKIVGYGGCFDYYNEEDKGFIEVSVIGDRSEKSLAELLEFLRLEFYARMIPTPDIVIQFNFQYAVEL